MNMRKNILYIDDDPQQFGPFSFDIQSCNEEQPVCAETLNEKSVKVIIKKGIDIAFIDYDLSGTYGIEVARKLKEEHEKHGHTIPIHFILLTGKGSENVAKEVLRSGLFQDYINKGIYAKNEIQRALFYYENIRRKEEELLNVTKEINKYKSLVEDVIPDIVFENGKELIGNSEVINNLKRWVSLYSTCDEAVLIIGPSGSGKELIARAIHFNHKKRKLQNFIAVNCAALPGNLIESELFGYVNGAFTGASVTGQKGKFEAADKGTLFLDEIGDLSLSAQAKILRVLQEGTITRLGSDENKSVDVRLICATNKDLKSLIEKNEFREDLYYRISGFFPKVKSLSEHKEDICLLVEYFANQCKSELKKIDRWTKNEIQIFSNEAIKLLEEKEWQGNIRELQKFIRQVIFLFQNEIPFDKSKVEKYYKHWKELNPNFEFMQFNHNSKISNDLSNSPKESKPDEALVSVLNNDFDKWEERYQNLKKLRETDVKSHNPDKEIVACKNKTILNRLKGNKVGYLLPKFEDIDSNAPDRFKKTTVAGRNNRNAAKELLNNPQNKYKWAGLRTFNKRFYSNDLQ